MKRSAPLGVAVGLVACSGGADNKPQAQPVTVRQLSMCEGPIPRTSDIGKMVAVRGVLDQDIETVDLVDERCPNNFMGIRYSKGGPDALGCMGNKNSANCGGLSHSGQVVTIVGILRYAAWEAPEKHKDPLMVGSIEVVRFEGAVEWHANNGT